MRETAPCVYVYQRCFNAARVEERAQGRELGGVRTSTSAVTPEAKEAERIRYDVCTTLTALTKMLAEKTARTMIL